jgi:hypothetical protein
LPPDKKEGQLPGLPLAYLDIGRVLAFATITTRWQAIIVIVKANLPIAICAGICAFSGFFADIVHSFTFL